MTVRFGWHAALQILGVLMIVVALPFALARAATRRPKAARSTAGAAANAHGVRTATTTSAATGAPPRVFTHWTFPLLLVGSMCSIGAVGGTMQNLKLLLSLDKGLSAGRRRRASCRWC